MQQELDLTKLYSQRFSELDLQKKNQIWKVLTKYFFQQWVTSNDTVVDIGAGYCEFINHIQCKNKIAVDLNPAIKRFAHEDVKIIYEPSSAMTSIASSSAQVVFMSNFLEHLKSKDEVLETFSEARRILSPSGKLLILQPNIRFLSKSYWDFFDHHTPLSDISLCEGLQLAGFQILKSYAQFLPYTTKSKIPQFPFLVRLYLKFPLMWKLMGKQCCVVAEKS